MSSDFAEVDPSAFAAAIEDLIGDIPKKLGPQMERVVRKTCKVAKEDVKSRLDNKGQGLGIEARYDSDTMDRYQSGFTYKLTKHGNNEVSGHVGNKNVPGLVHLLEKGHALVGGGRARRFPHLEPAFKVGAKVLEEEAEKALEASL